MTEKEHDALIGKIVREQCEARRDLAYLDIKAKDAARTLHRLADEMTGDGPNSTITNTEHGLVVRDGNEPERDIRVPDTEEIATLIDNRHRAIERVRTLTKQRKQLGID